MNSGQSLSDTIKKSRIVFEDAFLSPATLMDNLGLQNYYKMKLLQSRLSSESLIAPFSVFTISNRTLLATVATIVSYIVILIKLRGVEEPSNTTLKNIFNETST